jgi:hypothetical protein
VAALKAKNIIVKSVMNFYVKTKDYINYRYGNQNGLRYIVTNDSRWNKINGGKSRIFWMMFAKLGTKLFGQVTRVTVVIRAGRTKLSEQRRLVRTGSTKFSAR